VNLQGMTGARLKTLFCGATAPDPVPQGFLPGRILTAAIDPYGMFIGGVCRFWLGKRFSAGGGVNVVTRGGQPLLRALAPSQPLEPTLEGNLEGFPFEVRREKGAADPDVEVMALTYGIASNPSLLLRRLRDELVRIEDGLYLGKILYRVGESYRPLGFFSLEA
jgi:hypothetical protein